MIVKELVTFLGFDADIKPLKDYDEGVAKMKTSLIALTKLAVGAGVAIAGMAKLTSQAGQEIAVTAKKIGVSTDELQEYRFAAEQAGVAGSTMDGIFQNLRNTIGQARQGFGEGRVGIELLARETGTLIDLNGTVEQQFQTINDALLKIKDPMRRVAVAQKFFGSGAEEAAIFLEQGSDAINRQREEFRLLGGVMSKDLIKSSRRFEKSQKVILAIMGAIRNEIAEELLPIASEFIDGMKEWFFANRDLIKQNITKFIKFLVATFTKTVAVLKKVIGFASRIVKLFGGLEKVMSTLITAFVVFQGLQIAQGFGQIVLSGFQFIKMLRTMGSAALIAQAKVAAIPLAIVAIIAAIALIAEDIVSFTEGRDSVFGRLINGFDTIAEKINDKMGGLGDLFKQIIAGILAPVRLLVNTFKSIVDIIDVIRGKATVLEGLGKIGENLSNLFTGAKDGDIGLLSALGFGGKPDEAVQQATTISPAKGIGSATTKNNNTQNNINGKFDINVTGLPPEQAQQAARDGFSDIMGTVFRQAQRDTEGEVER